MSRSADILAAGVAVALLQATPAADGQTIGDYSRAQRAAIEAAMARQQAPAGESPATPLPPLPAAPAPANAHPPARAGVAVESPPRDDTPEVSVTGALVSNTRSTAEVVVNGVPFLLEVGQRVPESDWVVGKIADDRVVLVRRAEGRPARPATRTFALASPERRP